MGEGRYVGGSEKGCVRMLDLRDFVFYGDKQAWFCSVKKDGKLDIYGGSSDQDKKTVREQIRDAFKAVTAWED